MLKGDKKRLAHKGLKAYQANRGPKDHKGILAHKGFDAYQANREPKEHKGDTGAQWSRGLQGGPRACGGGRGRKVVEWRERGPM
ncbi:hypothetical protein N9L68_01055 [bacterium]|nr:hypothetical protein [bacterium]